MVLSFDFCERRATDAATAAATATLDNVRQRELRSEAAWMAMAAKMKAVVEARSLRDLATESEIESDLLAEQDAANEAEANAPA